MKVQIQVGVIEGYSDKPTGKLSGSASFDLDLLAVPREGDYVETGWGSRRVRTVFWQRDGSVIVQLETIYTLSDSQEDVLAMIGSQP